MPCLHLSTNVSFDASETSTVLAELTSIVAKLIGKPEAFVMVVLKGSVPIACSATEEPAAFGELVSVGSLDPEVNKKISGGLAEYLETKLKIAKTRFFLKFYDSPGDYFGWNGSTL